MARVCDVDARNDEVEEVSLAVVVDQDGSHEREFVSVDLCAECRDRAETYGLVPTIVARARLTQKHAREALARTVVSPPPP